MGINYQFLADNLKALLGDVEVSKISDVFKSKDANGIAEYVNRVARDVRARCSTLNFPKKAHEYGAYKPSRHLGMATRYMDEISQAIKSKDSKFSTDELGWHAFGAAVQALAGILQHIEKRQIT